MLPLHHHPLPPVVQLGPGEQDARAAGLDPEPDRVGGIEGEGQGGVGRLGIDEGDVGDDALGAVDADGDFAEVFGGGGVTLVLAFWQRKHRRRLRQSPCSALVSSRGSIRDAQGAQTVSAQRLFVL